MYLMLPHCQKQKQNKKQIVCLFNFFFFIWGGGGGGVIRPFSLASSGMWFSEILWLNLSRS